MKRSILAVVATTAAVVSFSCKKEKQPEPVLVSSTVEVTLGSPTTKVFGDGSTESFEKEVHNVVMFVYRDGTDICAYQREFTQYEIDKGKAVFAIPNVVAGATYDFYAIANCDFAEEMRNYNNGDPATTGVSRNDLKGKVEGVIGSQISSFGNLAAYNGTFSAVTGGALRGKDKAENVGFAMSGMASATAPAAGSNEATKVLVQLRRTVAKIAVKTAITKEFQDKYPGSTLTIQNAVLSQLANRSTLIKPDVLTTIEKRSAPFSQVPNILGATAAGNTTGFDQYQNLFYIFENAVYKADGSLEGVSDDTQKPMLALTAQFDFDGNLSTTGDQSTITYNIKLSGEAGNTTEESKFGYFVRNGNYLVNISIKGLTENEVVATVEVMDWETLIPQDVVIGDKD
ncbi:MAG: FimB/Mfa2 family fimbrial subunit [Rikenella sp.]|nr:FimB/Mfa2 family fimbrial subunit [Rikenella sp.]